MGTCCPCGAWRRGVRDVRTGQSCPRSRGVLPWIGFQMPPELPCFSKRIGFGIRRGINARLPSLRKSSHAPGKTSRFSGQLFHICVIRMSRISSGISIKRNVPAEPKVRKRGFQVGKEMESERRSADTPKGRSVEQTCLAAHSKGNFNAWSTGTERGQRASRTSYVLWRGRHG